MTNLIPFTFEERPVRTTLISGEPWFVGKDVCDVLDLRNHNDALSRLDDDETQGVGIADPLCLRPGGAQTMTVVSEPGVYRLVFTSRKPEAERFKRWLAHVVLPALRKRGAYDMAGASTDGLDPAADQFLLTRLAAVREARMVFGARGAREMWKRLRLPDLTIDAAPAGAAAPEIGPARDDEGWRCLDALLSHSVAGTALRLADLVRETDADFADATGRDDELARHGLAWARDDEEANEEGLVVASSSPALQRVFSASAWARSGWRDALRLLPGARPWHRLRYGGVQSRGTFIPLDVIERALDRVMGRADAA